MVPDKLLLVAGIAPEASNAAFLREMAAVASDSGASVDVVADADAAAQAVAGPEGDEAPGAPPRARRIAVVVVAPEVERPLAFARRLARALPDTHVVIVTPAGREAALRRKAVFGAPPGGRWSIETVDSPSLRETIVTAFAASVQRSRLRTTLDRASQRMTARPPEDAGEMRRLRVSDRYLARVLAHAGDAIVSLDAGGRVVSWNEGAERLFGVPAGDAIGGDFAGFFEDREHVRAVLGDSTPANAIHAELVLAGKDGARFVEAVFDRLGARDERDDGIVAIVRDITQRHETQRMLEESNRQKDEFLAMLGHELRNPLAPIRNAALILDMLSADNAKARAATAIIARQVAHMTTLIDDLLDVARVSRGIVVLDREPVALSAIVTEALEQAQPLITLRGHAIDARLSAGDAVVLGDRKRLVQVVANLLSNAAKYTPEHGRLCVHLRSGGGEACIVVEDNGIGMDADLLPRVFDLFAQGGRSPDRSQGGLGLGLALVRSLVALHGGSVTASSAGPHRGSCFIVRLPKLLDSHDRLAPLSAPALPATAARPLRIQVVDDNADAATTLSALLEALGHVVQCETDPRRALAHAPAFGADVHVLDIGMPHLDGYQLARALRSDERLGHATLVALTGYGQPADRQRALDAGFDHHLVKPLDAAALDAILGQVGSAA